MKNYELEAISLYPNPATDQLKLELPEGVNVEKTVFFNSLGQKIKETATATSWDISGFSTGVYFIHIATNLGSKQMKFLKN